MDTSVLKHAVDRRIVSWSEDQTVNWGGQEFTTSVVRWGEDYPQTRAHPELLTHLVWIPLIAHLARRQRVELLVHFEILEEFGGLPKTRDSRGLFLGAPLGQAPDPINYGRIVAGGPKSGEKHQLEFLDGLRHPRFLELQRVTGANNPGPNRRNQLADAFHIWTAEEARVDYFLTTDLSLVRSAKTNRPEKPRVPVVAPQTLMVDFFMRRVLRVTDVISFTWYHFRTKGRGPAEHWEEQLLELSRRVSAREKRNRH